MNGMIVIFATKKLGGGCDVLLFTLRSNENLENLLTQLSDSIIEGIGPIRY